MDKTTAIKALMENPHDFPALCYASQIAVAECRWNEALTLAGRAVRQKPTLELYRRLALVTSKLGFALSTAVYLLAAIRTGGEAKLLEKSTEEWSALRKTLLDSSKEVTEIYQRLVPSAQNIQELQNRIRALPDASSRIREYEKLLSKGSLPIPLSYFLAAELIHVSKLHQALHVSTAALLKGDLTLHTLVNLVGTFIKWRRGKEVVALAQATVNLFPGSAGAWGNLGGAFDLLKRPWESINACQHAISLDPKSTVALNNLGNSWKNAGNPTEAAKAYELALEILQWKDNSILSNYLLSLQYANGYSRQQIASAHLRYGQLYKSMRVIRPRVRSRDHEKLRVGFLSADFVNHSAAYFLLPLWEQLNQRSLEIHAYHNLSHEDMVSAQLKAQTTSWKIVHHLDDASLRELLIRDEIDVLVDTAGHTSRNRLAVFGMRSAPIQVTWLGHPNTTGLRQMDYRITDEHCDPLGSEPFYSEQLIRMPSGIFGVYRPLVNRPNERGSTRYCVTPPPALEKGHVTFGSCNNLAKITDDVVGAWSRILHSVPASKLLIESPGLNQREFRTHTLDRFAKHGVAHDRLDLRERESVRQYLIYNEIDICLDPFPCNGGTTSFDLLWMGVPLVTLKGDSFVSRMGSALLMHLGYDQFIAETVDDYVDKARDLALDTAALEALRSAQRSLMEASPLMDEVQFGEDFETLLWTLHENTLKTGAKHHA
jgi:protein O-GlcNAc transferase